MKNKTKIIIVIIVAIGLALIGYFFLTSNKSVPIEAKFITVEKGAVTTMVTATGTIEPITQVEVGTQVSGVVEKIYVDYNSEVKEGQLIAELDKTNLQSAVSQTQASYNSALNEKNYLQTIFDRQKSLYDNQVISKSDYDEALYNLNNSKSTVVQRLSDLEKAKTNLSYAYIYSPINGVVLSRAIDEGQTVAASYSTPTLFTIAQDLKEMQVEADVDEADIGDVKEGQRVTFTVDAYQDQIFGGVVTQVRLDPTITSNVVTYTVVIKADNPDFKLKPGLTATISIYTLELKDILTVEAKAVNFKPNVDLLKQYEIQENLEPTKSNSLNEPTDLSKSSVWVYGQTGTIEEKEVRLGASDGVNVQILSGLQEGEKLVYSLKESTPFEMNSGAEANQSPFMPKPPGKK